MPSRVVGDPASPDFLTALIDAFDPASITTTVTAAKYLLGVDINASGDDDVLTLATTGLDASLLDFDVAAGDLDALVDAIFSGTVSDPLLIGAAVSVDGLALSFTGAVFDEASDPPFTLGFAGVSVSGTDPFATTAVPEPATLALLLAGLGLMLPALPAGGAAGRRRPR